LRPYLKLKNKLKQKGLGHDSSGGVFALEVGGPEFRPLYK
jgi:hypothetical protein